MIHVDRLQDLRQLLGRVLPLVRHSTVEWRTSEAGLASQVRDSVRGSVSEITIAVTR